MKYSVSVREHFGEFCADGEAALRFRMERVDPYIELANEVELDFAGVRNANSSFCNALVPGLVVRHSPDVIRKLRFANCQPSLKIMLSAALELGVARWSRERNATAV
jgi:hypothetical protein